MIRIKKSISVFLVLAILIGCFPVSAHAVDTNIYEVTKNSVTAYTGPGKDNPGVVNFTKGDCLRVVDRVTNDKGNLWFEVEYGSERVYVYSNNVKIHEHNYETIDDNIAICKCGFYKESSNGQVQRMNTASGQLLNSDWLKVLSAMEAAAAASTAAAAASPYVAVVVLSGATLFLIINLSGTVKQVQKSVDGNITDFIRKTQEKTFPYYRMALIPGSESVVIDPRGLSTKEATKYLIHLANNPANAAVGHLQQTDYPLLNIWAINKNLAKKLCKSYAKKTGGSYGISSTPNGQSEADKYPNKTNAGSGFLHFHIHNQLENSTFQKVCNVHVMYGDKIQIKKNTPSA